MISKILLAICIFSVIPGVLMSVQKTTVEEPEYIENVIKKNGNLWFEFKGPSYQIDAVAGSTILIRFGQVPGNIFVLINNIIVLRKNNSFRFFNLFFRFDRMYKEIRYQNCQFYVYNINIQYFAQLQEIVQLQIRVRKSLNVLRCPGQTDIFAKRTEKIF